MFQPDTNDSDGPANCVKCKHPLKPGAKFCFSCGHRTEELDPPSTSSNLGAHITANNRMCGTCGKTVYEAESIKFRSLVFHKIGCFMCHYPQCQKRMLTKGKAIESLGKIYCSNTCACLDQNMEIVGGGRKLEKPKPKPEGPKCTACKKPCGSAFVKLQDKPYHKACVADQLPTCSRCGDTAIGRILKIEDQRYHTHCFTCCLCQAPLATYVLEGESLFCEHCATKAPAEKQANRPVVMITKSRTGLNPTTTAHSQGGLMGRLQVRNHNKKAVKTKASNEALTLPIAERGEKMIEGSHKEGYMKKKGGSLGRSKERFFVLLDWKLEYYDKDVKNGVMSRTGGMPLFNCCSVQPKTGSSTGIVVSPNTNEAAKTYYLEAPSPQLRNEWVTAIKARISASPARAGRSVPAPTKGKKMINNSFKEGFLRKKGGALGNWKTRYFVLSQFPPKMAYYEYQKDTKLMFMTGDMPILNSTVVSETDDAKCFTISPKNVQKTFVLAAENQAQREEWIAALKEVVASAGDVEDHDNDERSFAFRTV